MKLFSKKLADLEQKLADKPEDQGIKDDIVTLKAAAKLLGLAI